MSGRKGIAYTFPQLVAVALGACFTAVTYGVLVCLIHPDVYSASYQATRVFNWIYAGLIIIVTLCLLRFSDLLEKRGRTAQSILAIALFVLMGIGLFTVAHTVRVRPHTDSYDCLEAAAYILRNGKMDAAFRHVRNIGRYSNNRFLILVFKCMLSMFSNMDAFDFLRALSYANACMIIVAIVFTYALVRKHKGAGVANRVLVLCTLNPLYYGLVCWLYSLTVSLPIMMCSLFVGLLVYRTQSLRSTMCWALLEGVLMALGYEIRPTACFPLVAMAIVALWVVLKRKGAMRRELAKKYILTMVAASVALCCCISLISSAKHRYFSEVEDRTFPITYWLSMGSYGNGNTSNCGEDMRLGDTLPQQERFWGLLNRTLENYRSAGILKTIVLWGRKMAHTWCNGYSGINARMSPNEAGASLAYEFMSCTHKDLFVVYCNAFRLFTILGVVFACLKVVSNRHGAISILTVTLLLTVMGAVMFYWLWEAKNVYSAPFVLVMILLAEEGWSFVIINLGVMVSSLSQTKLRAIAGVGIVIALSAIVALAGYIIQPQTMSYCCISSVNTKRVSTRLNAKKEVRQQFVVDSPFNRIILGTIKRNKGRSGAGFIAKLEDASGNVLQKWRFTSSDIENGRIVLKTDEVRPHNGEEWFELSLTRLGRGHPPFYLVTGDSVFFDSYRGSMFVDGIERQANDLKMDVRYEVVEPYLSLQ